MSANLYHSITRDLTESEIIEMDMAASHTRKRIYSIFGKPLNRNFRRKLKQRIKRSIARGLFIYTLTQPAQQAVLPVIIPPQLEKIQAAQKNDLLANVKAEYITTPQLKADKVRLTQKQTAQLEFFATQLENGETSVEEVILNLRAGDQDAFLGFVTALIVILGTRHLMNLIDSGVDPKQMNRVEDAQDFLRNIINNDDPKPQFQIKGGSYRPGPDDDSAAFVLPRKQRKTFLTPGVTLIHPPGSSSSTKIEMTVPASQLPGTLSVINPVEAPSLNPTLKMAKPNGMTDTDYANKTKAERSWLEDPYGRDTTIRTPGRPDLEIFHNRNYFKMTPKHGHIHGCPTQSNGKVERNVINLETTRNSLIDMTMRQNVIWTVDEGSYQTGTAREIKCIHLYDPGTRIIASYKKNAGINSNKNVILTTCELTPNEAKHFEESGYRKFVTDRVLNDRGWTPSAAYNPFPDSSQSPNLKSIVPSTTQISELGFTPINTFESDVLGQGFTPLD